MLLPGDKNNLPKEVKNAIKDAVRDAINSGVYVSGSGVPSLSNLKPTLQQEIQQEIQRRKPIPAAPSRGDLISNQPSDDERVWRQTQDKIAREKSYDDYAQRQINRNRNIDDKEFAAQDERRRQERAEWERNQARIAQELEEQQRQQSIRNRGVFGPKKSHLGDKFIGRGIQDNFNKWNDGNESLRWGGDDVGWQMMGADGGMRNLTDSEQKLYRKARGRALAQNLHTSWNSRTPSVWQGALSNKGVASMLGSVLPFTGVAAATSIVSGVRGTAGLGRYAVEALGQGIKEASQGLIKAGVTIVETIGAGVTQALGRSGQGVSKIFSAGVQGGGNLLSTGINAASGIIGAGAGLAGGAVAIGGGLVGAGIGGALGLGVGSAPGALVGGALGVGAAVILAKMVASVASMVSKTLGALGEAFGKFGEVAGKVLSGVIDILQDAYQTGQRLAGNVMGMSRGGAYSVGGSYSMIRTFGAFGISAEQTAGMFANSNALTMAPRTAAWGLGGVGADGSLNGESFMTSLRSQFQGFISQYGAQMGTMIGRTMLRSMGIDNPQMLRAVSTSGGVFNRQMANARELSLSPAALRKWDEDISLLQTTIGQFIEWAKVQIGQEFLPMFQDGLENLIGFVKDHKDEFIDSVKTVGEWFYVKLPFFIKTGLKTMIEALQGWLPGIAKFVDQVVDIGSSMIDWAKELASKWRNKEERDRIKEAKSNKNIDSETGLRWSPGKNQWIDKDGNKYGTIAAYEGGDDSEPVITGINKDGMTLGNRLQKGASGMLESALQMLGDPSQGMTERERKFAEVVGDTIAKKMSEVDVKVESKVIVEATSDMYAKIMDYQAQATWRKMSIAAGG